MQGEVAQMIYRLKREARTAIESVFETMKQSRADLQSLEREVRAETPSYNSVKGLPPQVA